MVAASMLIMPAAMVGVVQSRINRQRSAHPAAMMPRQNVQHSAHPRLADDELARAAERRVIRHTLHSQPLTPVGVDEERFELSIAQLKLLTHHQTGEQIGKREVPAAESRGMIRKDAFA
jgi:hypothetical protein